MIKNIRYSISKRWSTKSKKKTNKKTKTFADNKDVIWGNLLASHIILLKHGTSSQQYQLYGYWPSLYVAKCMYCFSWLTLFIL